MSPDDQGGMMLRGAPERNVALELIRLALKLVRHRCENDISDDLKASTPYPLSWPGLDAATLHRHFL
jgi:hypothetical protein